MKKTLLYSVLALGLIGASVGGYVYYIVNVKTYNTADKKVSEITEEEYNIDLPNGNPAAKDPVPPSENVSTDSDASQAQESTAQEPSASKGNKTESQPVAIKASSNPNSHSPAPSQKVTVQQIKNEYRPVFESLQEQANGRLDSLVGHAESEYHTKKASGEKVRVGYFVSKYKSAGETLEANTDKTFNIIYSALQSDLKKNGYKPNEANEFKDQYESEKDALRDLLFSKVKERL
jgi:ABC-type cobalt transport system substrate-binding protein